jgi:hypothetical protein
VAIVAAARDEGQIEPTDDSCRISYIGLGGERLPLVYEYPYPVDTVVAHSIKVSYPFSNTDKNERQQSGRESHVPRG